MPDPITTDKAPRPDVEGIVHGLRTTLSTVTASDEWWSKFRAVCAYALRLEEENAALAAWQCPFHDGKSGLTSDEHGHQYCAKEKRIAALLPMTEYGLIGAGFSFDRMKNPGPSSFTGYAHGQSITKAQYDAARSAVDAEKQTPYDLTNDLADMEREEGYEEGGGG